MRVVIVEPFKHPEIREIEDSLEAMQKVVGGTMQSNEYSYIPNRLYPIGSPKKHPI